MAEVRGISGEVVGLVLFGRGERQRYTQDTPILPDVWELFAARPTERHDLLIMPLESCSAVRVLRRLMGEDELRGEDGKRLPGLPPDTWEAAQLAPLWSFVGARLTFDELIRFVLPYTRWMERARERFETSDGHPFDPQRAFDQVMNAALGRSQPEERGDDDMEDVAGRKVLRGQLFEIARIVTLAAAIYVSMSEEIDEIESVARLEDLRESIVETMDRLLTALRRIGRPQALIGRVTSNRPVKQATLASRATVKGDAAFRLFDVKCADITWGVIDSGIDRDHPAFRDSKGKSRVVRSYELGILRDLLNVAFRDSPHPRLPAYAAAAGLTLEKAAEYLGRAHQSYSTDILDWSSIEPLLRVVNDPKVPTDGHGTHVAGIIGGHWEEGGETIVSGLCPDIKLMDFRIIGNDLDETEFAVLGALQLVRYLNSHNQYIVVHGVNMSLSIPHKVASFACGRTPVCDECHRLINAGVTVVAAAGNAGHHDFQTGKGTFAGFATVSITDPGNAEDVITVGATHKYEPHAYGVSYFSSRGPTGDGRLKPDLVAPGERIVSALPREETGQLDGTSQAAPHVSAAAAMLMARYPELNRSPRRIKRILCESATDLGRERSFQGHGLLDILRALQSF